MSEPIGVLGAGLIVAVGANNDLKSFLTEVPKSESGPDSALVPVFIAAPTAPVIAP